MKVLFLSRFVIITLNKKIIQKQFQHDNSFVKFSLAYIQRITKEVISLYIFMQVYLLRYVKI